MKNLSFNTLMHFIAIFLFSFSISFHAFGHNLDIKALTSREWSVSKTPVKASFLMKKNNLVYLERENGITLSVFFSNLSASDQQYVNHRMKAIEKMNREIILPAQNGNILNDIDPQKPFLVILFISFLALITIFIKRKNSIKYAWYIIGVGLFSTLYSFTVKAPVSGFFCTGTNPLTIDSAFAPFKPHVATRWDATYFYVESNGIPTTHPMMKGITGWQQQFPIPQCYIGSNAWSIPLNPEIATNPVPVNPSHFLRGAIALAVNGIAIFNPFTNTGVDALLDGQLDQWGGHCGRADDYHYHIAPLHLYDVTQKTLPIAYALDGFAVYGAFEPDGTAMLPLDANHGHYGPNGIYHYHGTTSAPYMIGKMVGKVTEDNTLQIIPQAQASPIRPAGTPLKGAVITSCEPNGPNGYILTYSLSGQTYKVSYSWTNNGTYTFNFINPNGSTTSTYKGHLPCDLATLIEEFELEKNKIEIFPNPAEREFSINLPQNINPEDIQNISVFDQTGSQIFASKNYVNKIETDNYAPGIYFVHIKIHEFTFVNKIIIK